MNIKKTLLLLTFFLNINYTVYAHFTIEQPQADPPSLNKELERAKEHLKNNRLDSATLRLQKAKKMLPLEKNQNRKLNDLKYLKVYFDLLLKKTEHQRALQVAQQMMTLSTQLNDQAEIAESYYTIRLALLEIPIVS